MLWQLFDALYVQAVLTCYALFKGHCLTFFQRNISRFLLCTHCDGQLESTPGDRDNSRHRPSLFGVHVSRVAPIPDTEEPICRCI